MFKSPFFSTDAYTSAVRLFKTLQLNEARAWGAIVSSWTQKSYRGRENVQDTSR